MKKHSEAKFDILKCEPTIVKLIRQMNNGTLDSKLFPYVGNDQPKRRVVVGQGNASAGGKSRF